MPEPIKSLICIRLVDGKVFHHHGKIADELFTSFAYTNNTLVHCHYDGGAVCYPRQHVTKVVYSDGSVKNERV